MPTGPEPTLTKSLTKEFRLQQQVVEDFWKSWTKNTCWNFAHTTRFDNPVEGRLDFALETLFSCKRRCDLAICGNGGELRICDQVEMGKREQSFSAPRMEGVWLARFSWSSLLRLTRVGRMWRMTNYNLCILFVFGW